MGTQSSCQPKSKLDSDPIGMPEGKTISVGSKMSMRSGALSGLAIGFLVMGTCAGIAGPVPLRDGLYATGTCLRGNPAALLDTFQIATATEPSEAPKKGARYIGLPGGEMCFFKNGQMAGDVFSEKTPCRSFGASSTYKSAMPLPARAISLKIVDDRTVVFEGKSYKWCW